METVSNSYKSKCKSNILTGAIGSLTVVSDNTIINENNDLVKITIEDNCYVSDKFIGTAVAKKLEAEIINKTNQYNLENEDIIVKLGFEGSNNNNEEISYGNYIISKPKTEEVSGKCNVIGYDYMIKFDIPYVDNNTYPMSVNDFLDALCTHVGVAKGTFNMVNGSYMIQGNPFINGENCRTVLSAIAQLAGGFAKIGRDNKLYIITLSNSGNAVESIDGNNYSSINKNNTFGPINKLIIKMNNGVEGEESVRSDTTSISQNGECAITISENPFLINEDERELVIDNIFNAINGITYVPIKTHYYGYPYLDSGDKVSLSDTSDIQHNTYVLNHTLTFDGGFEGDIDSPALTKTQSAYKNTNLLKKIIYKVELAVDKINRKITSIISEIGDRSNKSTSLTQDVDTLTARVEGIDTISDTVTGNIATLENCANLKLHKLVVKGNLHLLYPSENSYPSEDLHPVDMYLLHTVENGTVYKYWLPFDELNYIDENVCDEFVIEDGATKLTKKVGIDGNGNKYELSTYTEETFNNIEIILQNGTNILQMENFPFAIIEATFLNQNQYTNVFSTKVETKSEIELAKAEINLEVEQKTDTDSLIASINLKPGNIKLEGTVTANEKFKINTDGSIETTDIRLASGGKVIGGDGMIGNLFFSSNGKFKGFDWLGFDYGQDASYNMIFHPSDVVVDVDIPENFKIIKAILTLEHTPIKWSGYDNYSQEDYDDISGYSRNLKLYKGNVNYDFYMTYGGEYSYELSNSYLTEIQNAFGSATYTPPNTVGNSISVKDTVDIKNSLTVGKNKLYIRTTNATPIDNNSSLAAQQTGMARAYINVIGYTNYESEENNG